MSNKQSSVEWLVSQLNKKGFAPVVTDDEIEQAKAMHEKEIGNAHTHGRNVERGIDDGIFTAEQYYNETFGGDND